MGLLVFSSFLAVQLCHFQLLKVMRKFLSHKFKNILCSILKRGIQNSYNNKLIHPKSNSFQFMHIFSTLLYLKPFTGLGHAKKLGSFFTLTIITGKNFILFLTKNSKIYQVFQAFGVLFWGVFCAWLGSVLANVTRLFWVGEGAGAWYC